MRKLGMDSDLYSLELDKVIDQHTEDGNWYQTPTTRVDPISHDNLTAIHSFLLWKHGKSKPAPILFYKALHPKDFFYYLYCRYPNWLTELGLIIVGISAVIACMRKREDTSGKLLVWTKAAGLNYRSKIFLFFFRMCTKILKKKHGDYYWNDIFYIYFGKTFPDIYILANQYYGPNYNAQVD